jgi:hypothetical protein
MWRGEKSSDIRVGKYSPSREVTRNEGDHNIDMRLRMKCIPLPKAEDILLRFLVQIPNGGAYRCISPLA